VTPFELTYAKIFGVRKLEYLDYRVALFLVCVILYLAVLVRHWTDGQIDIHNRTGTAYATVA